ncbi:hypothetical protein [Psychrobacter sp. JCM 18903]
MGGTSFDITMAKSGRTSLNRDIDFYVIVLAYL